MSGASSPPTLAGFVSFAQQSMGVPSSIATAQSVSMQNAFNLATEVVTLDLATISGLTYQLAVYNLAGHNLIVFGVDTPPSTFFAGLRTQYGLNSPKFGLVQSAGDNGSSDGLMIPDVFKTMSLADLQYLQTPWGQQYVALASRVGTVWGLT